MACQKDLLDAMVDEAFFDTILVGTDNVEVACTKFMLAARSPIFKRMFFGGFQEQRSYRICLDYPSVVLKVLIKYCYSDEVDLDLILDAESLTDDEAISLVQLRLAARYFELHDVANHIEKEIGESVFQNKESGCVCAILSELMNRIDDEGPFWDMFFQMVIQQPEECLLPNCPSESNQGAMVYHPRLLSKLLGKVEDKYVVVRCLQKWFEVTNMEDESSGCLLDVAKGVDLKRLSPWELSKLKPSPIFPMERIFEAFVHHGSCTKIQKMRSTDRVVYVSGSGVKCLDGYYHEPSTTYPAPSNIYRKEGAYGELACHFEIKLSLNEDNWTISVIPKDDDCVPLKMYKAFDKQTARKDAMPPFKCWKCVEGTDPTPLVAMMDTNSSIDDVSKPSLKTGRGNFKLQLPLQGPSPMQCGRNCDW